MLAGIQGVFFTIVSLLFRNQFLTAAGATGLIFDPAKEYFTIVAAGSILLFILITIMFAFNSQGDTHTLTKLFALSTVINVILDPLLIFGWLGFPALGISGAALATLISQAVFVGIAIRSLSSRQRTIRFHFSNLIFNGESVKKVLAIGLPAALTQIIYPTGMAALTFITSLSFLEAGVIALILGFRIEFFAFLPAVGFGFAAMAMIGQNMGAGNAKRAQEVFRKALAYGFTAAAGLGILAALFAGGIIKVFTDDVVVTNYTLSYLWIVALVSYGFLAASMVEANSFQAIGRSWPGFWIFFLKFMAVSIPISYLLTRAFGLPIIAIWITMVVGSVGSAIVGYVWFTRAMEKLDLRVVPALRNDS